MQKLHDIAQRSPAESLLNTSKDESNQRSTFRKYGNDRHYLA